MPAKIPLETVKVAIYYTSRVTWGWHWKAANSQECEFHVSGRPFGQYRRWRVDHVMAFPPEPSVIYTYRGLIACLRDAISTKLEGAEVARNRVLADVEKGLIASLRKAISAQLGGAEVSGLTLDKIEWKEER